MKSNKKNKDDHFKIEIGLKEGQDWSKDKLAAIKAHVTSHAGKRTPERKLKNEMLAIQYQMEAYVNNDKVTDKNIISLEDFLHLYLEALNLTFKKFAVSIDTTDGNLKKYLSGERKYSTDLALRFSHFFHTTPDLWLNVYIKNELLYLKKEKKQVEKYKKYNYEKVLDL